MHPSPTPLPYEQQVLHCVYVSNSQPAPEYEGWYAYDRTLQQCYGTVGYAAGYQDGTIDSLPAQAWFATAVVWAAVATVVAAALLWQAIKRRHFYG